MNRSVGLATRILVSLTVAAMLGAAATGVAAQDSLVRVGERVRLSTDSGAMHVGFVAVATPDVIEVLEQQGSRASVPVSTVTRIEVSRGQKSNIQLGAGLGFAAGALGTIAYCQLVDRGGCELFSDDITLQLALIYGALNGVVGGIVGSFIKTDRWEDVPLDRLHLSLRPQPDGRLALGFSVAF